MKIKKIKLLKALALTGAFGIVATVPVIVSSCSSTSDNNGGNSNNDNNNGGGAEAQKITPSLKSSVTLKGSLAEIYDSTGAKKTNELLATEIRSNLSEVFDNAADLEKVSDLKIEVDGKFPTDASKSPWTGISYVDSTAATDANKSWQATSGIKTVLYDTSLNQINIASLDDLHSKLTNDLVKNALEKANETVAEGTTLTVKNKAGLTDDLIHVNVEAKTSGNSPTTTNYDLQIPVSDINLVVSDLSVSVTGSNVETASTTTTNFTYNIGINDTVNFTQPTGELTLTDANKENANEALVSLGYATKTGDTYTLDDNKISAGLGVFNCTFKAVSVKQDGTTRNFDIVVEATPKQGYNWENGETAARNLTFKVEFKKNA